MEEAKILEKRELSREELIQQGTSQYLGELMLKAKSAGNPVLIKQIRGEVETRIAYMSKHAEYVRGAFRSQLDELINFEQSEELVGPEEASIATHASTPEAAHG